jgi:hypothetical protein
MQKQTSLAVRCSIAIAALAAVAGSASAQQSVGPDVIVGELPSLASYGPVTVNGSAMHAFAVGTTSCNKGNRTLSWIANNNQHPVIGQNLYRWRVVNGAGQFEQIGQSWLKHGFTALQGNVCSLGCTANPNGSALGVGCSDPYSAGLNGSQSGLGPRNHVNAFTGHYPYPFTSPGAGYPTPPAANNEVARRLQVRGADLAVTPFSSTTQMYFAEGQYVAPDDAAANNGTNNCSYRRVSLSFASPQFTFGTSSTHPTRREQPGIRAWAEAETGVTIQNWDVPGEGRFVLAYKVTPVNGEYHYEYCVQNINSHRSASSFRIDGNGLNMNTSLEGFRDVEYHSGEPYSNTDWTMVKNAQGMSWSNSTTFEANANANALRWGTMYTFRFRSTQAPTMGTVSMDLFRPGAAGSPNSISIAAMVPTVPGCGSIDFNNDGLFPDDADLIDLLGVMAGGTCSTGNCNTIDFNSDGLFPSDQDLVSFLSVMAGGPCL